MLEAPSPPKTFLGVSFILVGFDPDTHCKIRAKLVSSGGVDAGHYGPGCTHVVVGRVVYDDPLCVAARDDGKVVVTGIWVDHSYDIGTPVDPSLIMYRPVKDLNGIPGAHSLVICLTGYQRQDREDIMMMVSYMGAQFSKPLVANKVTHLICYKFEGEKYELAKRMNKIKLINHEWLEDCLRDWELLPEANYSKSTYELEMMEAEAKDSEEENDNNFVEQPRQNVIKRSPCTLKVGIATSLPLASAGVLSKGFNDSAYVQLPSNTLTVELKSTPTRENRESSVINKIISSVIPEDPSVSTSKASASGILNEASEKMPSPAIEQKELTTPKLTEASHIEAKVGSLSYSRKGSRRSSPEMQDGAEQGDGSPAKMQKGEVDGTMGNSSIGRERVQDVIASDNVHTPSKDGDVSAGGLKGKSPQKRKLEASSARKSPNMALQKNMWTSGSPVTSKRTQGPEVSSSTRQSLMEATDDLCLGHVEIPSDNGVDWAALRKELPLTSVSKCLSSGKRPRKSNLPSDTGSSGTDKGKNISALSSEHIAGVGKPDIVALETDGAFEGGMKQHALDASSSRRMEDDITKFPKQGNADVLETENDKADEKTRRTTGATKKTLGSRPMLRKSVNLKGSIYLTNSSDKSMKSPTEKEEMIAPLNPSNIINDGGSLQLGNVEPLDSRRDTSSVPSQDGAADEAIGTNDETQAPDEDECAVETRNDGDNYERVEMAEAVTANVSNEEESARNASNISGPNVCNYIEEEGDRNNENGQQVSEGTHARGKTSKGTKPSVVNKKQRATSSAKQNVGRREMKVQKRPKSNKKTTSSNKVEISPEAEKENNAGANADHCVSRGKLQAQKSSLNSEKITSKISGEPGERISSSTRTVDRRTEPTLFMLSGHSHRLRRRELQQFIRKLRGRVCRDSRQWSYQATHFIAPAPIRRTEKFFAAAASGRWILGDDYLDASNQAGKFLDEEPYEWHGNSLSEDGTINLEAPRKWRLLRERTGHGAFYDMNVIIYGECITPPLDTLKRAVKAGDGTILATSPPYSRFLNKGLDFAIVSHEMARVDIWVQEFLKHEIPCVVADYLVDYVCKPGYPLEKHVLYNTHERAERSLSRLQRKAEEIVDPGSSGDDGGELSCEVCGSTERGDVMLICGDEKGSVGCGIGTHIDCCDPPIEAVPEEDWFCPSCSKSRRSSSDSATKSKRRGSVLKSKR